MNKTKKFILLIVLAAFLFNTTACSINSKGTASDPTLVDTKNQSFTISGLSNGDITVSLSEIKAMEAFEGRVEGADSAGYPVVYDIKGAYFADLLEVNGHSQGDLTGIRIIASDGYSIVVSRDILQSCDIILAYEIDGKQLTEVSAPLRVFIPEERAMYWVKKVTKIEIMNSQQSDIVTGIYFMESIYGEGNYEDYEYLGSTYKVLNTKKVLDDYPGTKGDSLQITASDGLVKNETLENFYKGVINISSEKSPWFMSSTLSSGMFVRDMLMFKYGGNAFCFFSTALRIKKDMTLDYLLTLIKIESAAEYNFKFENTADKVIASSELDSWFVGLEDGRIYLAQNGSNEKIRDLVSISVK